MTESKERIKEYLVAFTMKISAFFDHKTVSYLSTKEKAPTPKKKMKQEILHRK